MKKPDLSPQEMIATRILRVQADLATASVLRGDIALRHASGDASAAEDLAGIEREIEQHQRDLARLHAAAEAAKRSTTETELEDARKLRGERLARIEALNGEVLQALDAVVAYLRGLPGLLTRLEAAEQERDTLFALLGHGQMRSRIGAQTSASTVLAALQSSGIGVIGPRLAQRVVIDRAYAVAPEVAAEHFRCKLAKELAELRELINPKVVETTTTTAEEEATQ